MRDPKSARSARAEVATPRPRRAFRAAILTPRPGLPPLYLEDGLLVVDHEGTIESVHQASRGVTGTVVTHDLTSRLIVPGFVDTHLHYPQTRVVGSATGPLLDWLRTTVFPEEARFSSEAYAREVACEFAAKCAAVGTTTVGAYSSSHQRATAVLFETLDECGLRGLVGLTLMDQSCPEEIKVGAEAAIDGVRALAATYHGIDRGRLRLAITPRFAISCSRALMEAAARVADELSLVVQTHVAENPREGDETLAAHGFAQDYLGVYEAVGLLGPRTILAHAIHLSASEWDRVARAGAAIAHCPDSNAFLGSGRMQLEEARKRGIVVGLGSDVAAGRTFDIRRVIAHAYDTALATGTTASMAELFEMATLGGARALGLHDVVGSLEPGKEADFVVLERPSYADGVEGALRCATFASEIAPVTRTYVRGRLIWHSPT